MGSRHEDDKNRGGNRQHVMVRDVWRNEEKKNGQEPEEEPCLLAWNQVTHMENKTPKTHTTCIAHLYPQTVSLEVV